MKDIAMTPTRQYAKKQAKATEFSVLSFRPVAARVSS
jgi:hypothetical protein